MGMLLRFLLLRLAPGRIGWVVAAWLISRFLARRQAASTAQPGPRRVAPMPVMQTPRRVN